MSSPPRLLLCPAPTSEFFSSFSLGEMITCEANSFNAFLQASRKRGQGQANWCLGNSSLPSPWQWVLEEPPLTAFRLLLKGIGGGGALGGKIKNHTIGGWEGGCQGCSC